MEQQITPTVTVRFLAKAVAPTDELVAKVRELARGGETCFEDACLRPGDERWWRDVTEGIAADMETTLRSRRATDAELIAALPETAYAGASSERERRAIAGRHIADLREGGKWVFYVGLMMRDAERRFLDGIHLQREALRARGQLRGFAVAIAMALGCATTERRPRHASVEDESSTPSGA